MTGLALWSRLALLGGAAAASLLVGVPRPGRHELALLPAVTAGAAIGLLLFAVLSQVRELNPGTRPASRPQLAFLCAWATVEELIWRRLAFGGLAAGVGAAPAFLVSTVAFAAVHRGGRVVQLLTGAAFCLAYVATGRLLAAATARAVYNLLVASSPRLRATRLQPE